MPTCRTRAYQNVFEMPGLEELLGKTEHDDIRNLFKFDRNFKYIFDPPVLLFHFSVYKYILFFSSHLFIKAQMFHSFLGKILALLR